MSNDVVDIRVFGAKADGRTDDAPAFNKAIRYINARSSRASGYEIAPRIFIPCGIYAISETINLTEFRAINTVIDGDGSVLLGRCGGQPVIDALGSRWLTIRDLTIIGDEAAAPEVGIQIGRS